MIRIAYIFFIVTSFNAPNLVHAQQPIIDCWQEVYKDHFDFVGDLTDFEGKLLDQIFLQDVSTRSYNQLFETFRDDQQTKDWTKLGVDQYLSAKKFKYCLQKIKPSKNDTEVKRWVSLFSIYHILSLDLATIIVKAYDEKNITINGSPVTLKEFKTIFRLEVDVMDEQLIGRDEIIVDLHVFEHFSAEHLTTLKSYIADYNIEKVNVIKANK